MPLTTTSPMHWNASLVLSNWANWTNLGREGRLRKSSIVFPATRPLLLCQPPWWRLTLDDRPRTCRGKLCSSWRGTRLPLVRLPRPLYRGHQRRVTRIPETMKNKIWNTVLCKITQWRIQKVGGNMGKKPKIWWTAFGSSGGTKGGGGGRQRPPGLQILSFSCSFRQNICKIIPPWELAPLRRPALRLSSHLFPELLFYRSKSTWVRLYSLLILSDASEFVPRWILFTILFMIPPF